MSGRVAPRSVVDCARDLRSGATTARALLAEVEARIDAHDAALRCYVARTPELAREQADAADARIAAGRARSALDGVPIALKDNIDVAGVATANGTARARVAAADAEVVRNLRAAGAVILGKLNMEEGALGAVTDNPHHGRTFNPHRDGYTPGGSSGGSGAAVAAGLAVAALGSDTLGSIRIPAAYCGVVGFKPSHGAASLEGVALLAAGLDCVGPLAARVADAAIVFGAMVGTEIALPDVDLAGVRLARVSALDAVPIEVAVAEPFARALDRLAAAGTSFARAEAPGLEPAWARRAAFLLTEREAAAHHGADIEAHPQAFSEAFRAMLAAGRDAPEVKIAAARAAVEAERTAILAALDAADALIMPTVPHPAFAFGGRVPKDQADLTAAANIAGAPAISVPCGTTADGLPVGLQLVGRPGEDARLLAIARAVEACLDEGGG